ncbi:helicase-related protein [Intestinibacter bartlettii]|uniref:helicase-related protein n=1 Tax=Intestinibacter bartlettii TaxID=261299 RepID=UPI001D12FCF1|nr:helicase-related protein [Intestinibacter bartlettii]MCC2706063.1 phospholipase D-like domain-containing protein [Intestinibacter bartlettii]MCC2761513.1 phospholipase D-like domain-containing protein [Intestinibacter bartlettii]
MENNYNDLTFFTNEEGHTLYDRFNKILNNNVQFFDILVGYFRSSGFYKMYESMENVEKTRILVGLNLDKKSVELIHEAKNINQIDFMSNAETKKYYSEEVNEEIEKSEDSKDVEIGIKKFIEFINLGKLEIRVYPHHSIHAKVYIMRKDLGKSEDYGKVITGSSNFSQSGLIDQLEFNVELKDSRDVRFAEEKFEELWKNSIEVNDEYIDKAKKSWIRDDITPYELFIKCLYEYFQEEINQDNLNPSTLGLPPGFMKLQYQLHAVVRAEKILETYNGVFLSDVVGLGKTYIAAMLAKRLRGRKLVICPPVLIDNWEKVLWEFDVSAKIKSLGKLDSILQMNRDSYDYVFIDEAHRFRNDDNDTYTKLHEICNGKKVVLISATPQNNRLSDIENQIYLFQNKNNSNIIPNRKDLEGFFSTQKHKLKKYDLGTDEYMEASKEVAAEVRDKVLNHIMVRRTRKEIIKYYKNDLEKQGLSFPNLNTPKKIVYEFDDELDKIFNMTLDVIKTLTYSRYKALTYLKVVEPRYKSLLVGQRNMGGFMKGILLKRLESSFYAFRKTLNRFVESYEAFIDMYNSGTIYISKKYNIYDLMNNGEEDKLALIVEKQDAFKFESDMFTKEFIDDLEFDLANLKRVKRMWEPVKYDPKLEKFLDDLKTNKLLKTNKILIFSESKETAEYLAENINKTFNNQAILFTGDSSNRLRAEIENNFNPDITEQEQKNDYRILVTTDVLAEGISLHRANIIVNYDLPWNPTRIMQRVGRINRVGTKFNDIYVFNFFPSSQVSENMTLEENISSKIQAFHDTLGEDFKYLSENEDVDTYGIFGKALYDKLNSDKVLEEEDFEEDISLKYLNMIRDIRDNNEELFMKVKNYPKKIRSAKYLDNNGTITFFRKGKIKRFFITNEEMTSELKFIEAIRYFECNENEKKAPISKFYYENLKRNKEGLVISFQEDKIDISPNRKSGKNHNKELLKYLKAINNYSKFTEFENQRIDKLMCLFEDGVVPKNKLKEIVKMIKGVTNPVEILNTIWDMIPSSYIENNTQNDDIEEYNTEVVLSLDLV